jgi:hypothetical protein
MLAGSDESGAPLTAAGRTSLIALVHEQLKHIGRRHRVPGNLLFRRRRISSMTDLLAGLWPKHHRQETLSALCDCLEVERSLGWEFPGSFFSLVHFFSSCSTLEGVARRTR